LGVSFSYAWGTELGNVTIQHQVNPVLKFLTSSVSSVVIFLAMNSLLSDRGFKIHITPLCLGDLVAELLPHFYLLLIK